MERRRQGRRFRYSVGFIRDLPHGWWRRSAPRSEETWRADLLLHVVDSAVAAARARTEDVEQGSAEIDAQAIPRLAVWNKGGCFRLGTRGGRDEYVRISRSSS
jgi:50S ribosomal subunit-associated GTPase HflX